MLRPPFSEFATVYDAVMADVEYQMWCSFILREALKRGYQHGPLLDIGCGTGNATLLLAQEVERVSGLDRSQEMLTVARRKAPHIDWRQGEFTDFELQQQYSLVISVFDSLNNLLDPADFLLTARRVRAHLEPRGLFLFDVNTTQGLRDLWDGEPVEGWAGEIYYRWKHTFDPSTRLARVEAYFDTGDRSFTEVHYERAYDEAELVTLLDEAGFSDMEALEFPDGESARPDAERIWLCARR